MTDEAIIKHLTYPILIERPILIGDKAIIGRDLDKVVDLYNSTLYLTFFVTCRLNHSKFCSLIS
jgi:hypothetical protein